MDVTILAFIGIINLFVVASFALSGGIGLVMRPLMIFFGVPPQITIGTSRVSAIPGGIISQIVLHKSKMIDWKLVLILAPINVLGGLLGLFVIVYLDDVLLKQIIGVLLIFAAFSFMFNKKIGLAKSKPKLGKFHYLISGPIILILGSLLVIVGGTGPLAKLLFIFGYGKTYIEAAAIQKAINFWQTFITTFFFIALLLVDWLLLLVLVITSSIGTYVGTKFVLRKGERYLQILLVIVVLASAIKLIFFP